jgi:hypothetical protein
MSVRRSLSHVPAFVLAGAGVFLLLSLLYYHWGWLSSPSMVLFSPPILFTLVVLVGAGIGLLSWLGYELGCRRRLRGERSSSMGQRGGYLRDFAFGLGAFLLLGTIFGLIATIPNALGEPVSGSGIGVALLNVFVYVTLLGAPVLVPLINGLLTGALPVPNAAHAFFSGLAVTIGGGIGFLLPAILFLLLVLPACARTVPQSCGYWYFGPSFWVAILGIFALWAAVTVGLSSSIAASLGVLVARLADRRMVGELPAGE